MKNRNNYYQVHKNKKPKTILNLKFIKFSNHLLKTVESASKAVGSLISLQLSISYMADKKVSETLKTN